MIITIEARNVNDAYIEVLNRFKVEKLEPEQSRNGPVLRLPQPVCLTYKRPNERVLFDRNRNCNPFFHLMEGLWMLDGRNDVDFVAQFVGRMKDFSDNGKSLNGAYGFRWREHFDVDQLVDTIELLRENPSTRRAVIAMYDPDHDGYVYQKLGGKDVPCNTHIYFATRGEQLDMTVMARSNDAIWGALGANAVHMSMLHEFVATAAELKLGVLNQFSNDYHIYKDVFNPRELLLNADHSQPYRYDMAPAKLCTIGYRSWLAQLEDFLNGQYHTLTDPFLKFTALPMFKAWQVYKKEGPWAAEVACRDIVAHDWRLACIEWMQRKAQK